MKLEKKNKSIRTQTYSFEKVGASPSSIFYPLPFGPVRYFSKMDLIRRILIGSGDYDELSLWKALGLVRKSDFGDSRTDSQGETRESQDRLFWKPKVQKDYLDAIPQKEKEQILSFMKKLFGNERPRRLSILDIVFKDLFSSDMSNRENFQSYLDHHWTTILGKICLENLTIKANGKNVSSPAA